MPLVPDSAAGLGEFFRYHGAWAPGVRLFRAVRFRAKAAVITAVFLLPIGVLGWQYFADKSAAIQFSASERVGVAYQRAALPVLDALLSFRSAAMPGGDTAGVRPALDAALASLAQAQQGPGSELGVAKEYAALVAAIGQLPPAGAPVRAVLEGTAPALKAVQDLLHASNDRSNLTLDPDADTYYLMDGALLALPRLVEATARLQALAAADSEGKLDLAKPLGAAETASDLAAEQLAAAIAQVEAVHADLRARIGSDAVLERLHRYHDLATSAAPVDKVQVEGRAAAEAMAGLRGRMIEQLDGLLAARVARLELARNLTALALLLSLSLALYLFRAFQKVLEGGLSEVAHHINAMRDGNLTTTPRAWGGDEVAGLMATLTQMQDSLRGIVQQVRGASDGIVTAASQITAGAMDLSARTEASAASLQQSAAAMEEIATTTQNNAQATRDAATVAASNAAAAEQGGRIIGDVVQTMDGIRSASSRIAEIIGTIDGIAFQTNILALNAAVEAARAGESGRGFAVVASEVRALAQRSAGAAREIKTLIGQSVEQVEAGSKVVQAAGSTMQDLVGNAARVNALLASVATGIDEQARGVNQTAGSVQELDRATQQNAALVEESAAAAASLKDQALALAQRVAQFRLTSTA